MNKYIKGLISLLYPKSCGGCGGYLVQGENEICTNCLCNLSRTGFHNIPDNDAEKLFWNKVPVEYATAYCYFHKGGIAQRMLHNLKYKGYKSLGFEMGKLLGEEIKGSEVASVDYIVPVPLHPSKLKKRRYNQAEVLAQGISSVLCIPIDTSSLVRTHENTTQTKKNINERYQNSLDLFSLANTEKLKGCRVMLVDDVITTGATLEACVRELLKIEGVKVNCVAFAIAGH